MLLSTTEYKAMPLDSLIEHIFVDGIVNLPHTSVSKDGPHSLDFSNNSELAAQNVASYNWSTKHL